MDSNNRAKLDAAERSGYLPALRAIAKMSCAPFWWHGLHEDGIHRSCHSGSVCFLDTGTKLIAISADHVFVGYERDKSVVPNLSCQFGSMTIEPERRIVCRHSELDLITFDVSPVILASVGAFAHAPRKWPTDPVLANDVVLLGGYPGNLRVIQQTIADTPFQWFAGRVTSVSPSNIVLCINSDNFHHPLRGVSIPNENFGGLSGGPVFRLVASPIETIELVGFIYESSDALGLIYARPARCVTTQGYIDVNVAYG